MEKQTMKQKTLQIVVLYGALLMSVPVSADTTTTTTTTNPDGSTTVQETTTQSTTGTNLIGPTGVTGTIRRSDRRQDRRMEEDLKDLGDAARDRPRSRR